MPRRTKVLISIGSGLILLSMTVTGVKILLSPAERVLVVTMTQDAVQADRVALREACGGLPGVRAVADKGNPDPQVQGRFPVRFDITDATFDQERALTVCVNQNGSKVRGMLNEGDT
jgi:hypothetical protein